MKVLHIALSDGGGAGIGMMNQHRALLDMGVDSRVLVAVKKTDCPTVTLAQPNQYVWSTNRYLLLIEKIARRFGICFNRYDRIHHSIYKVRKRHNVPFSSPVTQYDLSRHPLVEWADVINLHYVSGFVDMATFFGNVGKPIVWTMRDENPGLGGFHYEESRRQYYKYYTTLEDEFLAIKRKAIQSCESLSLVSLSAMMRDFCKKVDFLANRRNTIIHNAIDPSGYTAVNKDEARRALGLSSDDTILSFVCCQLDERRKRLAETIEAIGILGDEHIKLVCVGNGDTTPHAPNIITLGTISDTQRLSLVYSASDAFVSPSAQESFGKTIVEALYCGTPVVSTPVGIAAEIIDESNGTLCGGTPREIAKAIGEVLARQHNRQAIRDKAVGMFAPANIARQYIELYKLATS